MWEPNERVIEELLKLYINELPRKLSETGDPAEHVILSEQRKKIGKLLRHSYGVRLANSLIPVAATPATGPQPCLRNSAPHLGINSSETHAPIVILEPSKAILASPFKSRMRVKDAEAVQKLRRQYYLEIPAKLAGSLSESQREALKARLLNIRNLVERGYGVPLGTKDEVHGL